MKIGIIGAGFIGLTAAYRLSKEGHAVTVFEKANKPGGLAIGYQEKNGNGAWKSIIIIYLPMIKASSI